MKHAGAEALATHGHILEYLRGYAELTERSPGVFYRKSRAFIHFHEDPAGFFADIRCENGRDFDRIQVDGATGLQQIIHALEGRLSPPALGSDP